MEFNMKTIAIIESCDTKYREAQYIKELVEKEGMAGLVIDVATGPYPSYNFDVSREEIVRVKGKEWKELEPRSKGEKIEFMREAVTAYVRKLYDQGRIDGVVSIGGLQNTVMATSAMRSLPIGFPKVMATTIACGRKTFDPVVGEKDVVVIPAICDFTGLNLVTKQVIANAAACCIGMVKTAGHVLKKGDRPVVGVTLMGITNTGACAAIDELERCGIEALGFHATGVGGPTMEQMAEDGLIDGILDLTVHEITEEYFGGGFSYGENAKIKNAIVADGCEVDGTVENSVLFRGVRIGKGSVVKNSIILQGVTIGEGVVLDHVVIDKGSTIRSGRTLVGYDNCPIILKKNTNV